MLHPINPRQHTLSRRELHRATDLADAAPRQSTLDEMYRRIDEDLEDR